LCARRSSLRIERAFFGKSLPPVPHPPGFQHPDRYLGTDLALLHEMFTGAMNLIEALETLKRSASEGAVPFRVFLACGFTPLHLQTFLAAHLRQQMTRHNVEVNTGLFGDLAGNIERLNVSATDALAVVIEWQDLDSRLGIRSLGGWRAETLPDVLASVNSSLRRLERALKLAAAAIPVCVCPPTLALPPLFTDATHQAGSVELQLRNLLASFSANISGERFVRVLSSQLLDERSPLASRFDVQSELLTGFPYRLPHVSTLAAQIATLIYIPAPKKGLITDLDDTLWAGILGEVGVDGISWDLDQHSQIHGLYQQFLSSLASAGVLIGVASKNDPALVEQAFQRKDLVISKDNIFPIEAHWKQKSESVRRILQTWNIAPEAVVFVDDNAMELAEVRAAFPEMECLLFPRNDPQAVWDLLKRLRDLFGKSSVSQEDALRLQSIRAAGELRDSANGHGASLDEFLQSANASIELDFDKQSRDSRALELINKTNQFNLNGKRLTDVSWLAYLNDPDSFLVTVAYEDKFGPLGKIAVLLGKSQGSSVQIDFWVMSCRAFSRRIEHQCLKQLFERFDCESISFCFEPTPRNGPLQEFFSGLLGGPPAPGVCLSRASFLEKCPRLFHRVTKMKEVVHA
jgi:FkbH-like protein